MNLANTILVVDDAPLSLDFLEDLFTSKGFSVSKARNGKEALDQVRKVRPDLIVSDVLMPVMDGFTFCRRVKEDERLRSIPFVFYTGNYNNPMDAQLGLSLGADLYLNKPMDTKVLTAMLQGLLNRSRTERECNLKGLLSEDRFLRAYSQSLVRKLEEQLEDLERVNAELRRQEAFIKSILNSLNSQIAVLDKSGVVKATNKPWDEFAKNPLHKIFPRSSPGENYIAVCERVGTLGELKGEGVARGIRQVIASEEPNFYLEYSLQLPTQDSRWFQLRILPLDEASGGAVIAHTCITEQKEAQKEVRAKEAMYRSLIESLSDHAFLLDLEGRYIATNGKCHHLGITEPFQLLGKTLDEVYPDPLGEVYRSYFDAVLDTRQPVEFEHPLGREGQIHLHLDTLYPVFREDRLSAVGGICRDITEQKLAERALKDSEERFRALYQQAPIAYQSLDADGRFLEINDKWLQVMGYQREEVIGKKFINFLRKRAAVGLDEHLSDFKEKGEFHNIDFEMIRKDGSMLTARFDGRIGKHADGAFKQTHCVFTDITERKKAEEALRKSEERHRGYVDNAPTGIFVVDVQGHYVMTNPAASKITGFSSEELMGKSFRDLTHPEYLGQALEHFQLLKTTGRAVGEFPLKTSSGEMRWCLIEAVKLNPSRLLGFATDITEQVLDRQELVRAKEQAEIANRAKSEFLANMSHEMRTPLNGAMAMLQLLKLSELTPEQCEYVDAALQASTNLTLLLTDILDLSRIEAGLLRLSEEPFELEEVLRTVQSTFRETSQEKGIMLITRVGPDAQGAYLGDLARIRQVLFNPVGNAVKFTEQGCVALEVVLLPTHGTSGSRLLFTIADTGIGIPEASLSTIFEPFTQVEGTYTKTYRGAGLGLNIVKRLVTLMDGSLSIESEVGKGTTVYFSLPLKQPASVSLPANQEREPLPVAKERKVLLAEDEKINRMALQIFLEKSGFHVACAVNGLEVLERLGREPFDLAIIDIQMPLMNGMEVIEVIRSSPKFANQAALPIIAMTAYAMAGDRERFLKAGATAYLPKPVNFHELRKMVDALLS